MRPDWKNLKPLEKRRAVKAGLARNLTHVEIAEQFENCTRTAINQMTLRMRSDDELSPAPLKAPPVPGAGHLGFRPSQDDVAARLAEVPNDTRDLTARIMGDPLPSRSALARRNQGA